MRPRMLLLTPAVVLALACGPREARSSPGAAADARSAPPARDPGAAPQRASVRRGDRHARAAARNPPTVKRAAGTVARADARLVVIRAPGGPPLTLRVGPRTAVTVDGVPTRAEALREGAEVRAAYRTGTGGRPTAITIEVGGPPSGLAPAPPPARGRAGPQAHEPEPSFSDQG